ncbi:MAG: DUF5123 domain-containing protein [Bacteroidota bacterium]|nr:DUF5123 domain-containing protein [Bacteroidota bacterium]
MKNRNIIKALLFLPLLMLLVFTGCKDEESLGNADRLFRPMINQSTISMTWIKIAWDKYSGTKYYDLEISKDSFKTVLQSNHTDSTQFTFRNLDFDTKYQIRIRAIGDQTISTGDTISSRYYNTELSTIDYPTLLTVPTSSDVIDNSIKVSWALSNLVYSRIDVMLNKDSVYKSVPLTAADNAAGVKIISGLQPKTSYIVKIFAEDGYKGKKTFKTTASQVFQGDVVDLRNYTDEQSKSLLTQLYVDSLGGAHPNGFNLVLSGGTTYSIPTLILPVPMNIVTGLSFRGKALMAVNGSIAVKGGITVDSIKFDKVFFTEGNASGKLKTDANFGATYVINMNQSGGNINKLIFENCDVKYKRGAIRMQTTANVSKLSINNCVFDSIADYGIVNNGNDASYIGDISVTNSTFAHCYKLFTCGKKLGINSLNISNITTCYTPYISGASIYYLFDYATNTVPGGITVKNSVFGTGSNTTSGGSTAVNGIRTATGAITSFTNCYKTSDLTWAVSTVDGVTPVAPINDLIDLKKTSAETFANPTLSNFKVTNNATLFNKIGDPRWW